MCFFDNILQKWSHYINTLATPLTWRGVYLLQLCMLPERCRIMDSIITLHIMDSTITLPIMRLYLLLCWMRPYRYISTIRCLQVGAEG